MAAIDPFLPFPGRINWIARAEALGQPPVYEWAVYNQVVTSQSPVARLIPVIAHAVAVFGDEQKATHWLSTPLPFLENRAPSDLLATDEGIELVEQTLTRIEHNIPS